MIVHVTIIDHACMLSDVIACAQWQLLIALHGGDRRLTHFLTPLKHSILLSHTGTQKSSGLIIIS